MSGGGCSGFLIKAPPIRNANDTSLAKWHRRFFRILEGSKMLEYWEDDQLKLKKGEVDLKNCTKVRPAVISKKFPFLFSIVLPDREWFFAADNEQEKKKWVDYLTSCCGDGIVRSQTVSVLPESYALPPSAGDPTSAPAYLGSVRSHTESKASSATSGTTFMATTEDEKPVWLRIAYPDLEMLDVSSMVKTKAWPLSHMRGYGQEKNCFSFDIGKRFPGAGHYVFYLQLGDDLFSRLDKIIAENASKMPLSSEPGTPDGSRIKPQTSSSSLPVSAYSHLAFDGSKASPQGKERPRTTSESPYTYVQTQTYVEVGSFTPQKPIAVCVDEGSSYAQVDIVRTQALGKALRNEAPATPQAANARKTRHDGITLPAPDTPAVETHDARPESTRPRQMSSATDQQDDLDDLLNSLDVEDGSSPSAGSSTSNSNQNQALYENTTKIKHSYVNLPNPA
eukprot:m.114031 g.114031  ORF g.114031 m.114031 type:complete len:451 (-) comp16017_c0_seq1:587-1939(-)